MLELIRSVVGGKPGWGGSLVRVLAIFAGMGACVFVLYQVAVSITQTEAARDAAELRAKHAEMRILDLESDLRLTKAEVEFQRNNWSSFKQSLDHMGVKFNALSSDSKAAYSAAKHVLDNTVVDTNLSCEEQARVTLFKLNGGKQDGNTSKK